MHIKEFKNKNINIQFEKDDDIIKLMNQRIIECICNTPELDFLYAGECITNCFGIYELYNVKHDKMYKIDVSECLALALCQNVKLVACDYNKEDYEGREIFENLK